MAADSQAKFRPIGLLALIVAAGFALRFININQWPLWGDEALTLLIAQMPYHVLFLAPVDPTPGLYYSLHKLFLGPLVDAGTARSISLVCGTLLIPAVYFLAREARVPALLSAALVALSFPLIDYSQEARAYSLLVLQVTLSAAFLVRWHRSDRQRDLMLALIFGALSFYTHFVSVFWLGPMVVAIVRKARRQAVQPLLVLTLASIPELARLISYQHIIFSWLAEATPVEASDTLGRALLPFRRTGFWVPAAALLLVSRAWARRAKLAEWGNSNRGAAFAISMLLLSPLLIWIFGLIAKPIFMTRTILIAVPAFMLALALLLRFEHRVVRFAVVALYAASLFVTGTTRQKEEWRAITGRVGSDAVLMCRPFQAPAMRHAIRGDNRIFLNHGDGIAELVGSPEPKDYFALMSGTKKIAETHRLAMTADPNFVIWPVRSGELGHQVARPTRLGHARAFCNAFRTVDGQPRYIAE